MFDWIEVGGVSWQRQQSVSVVGKNFPDLGLVMKGRVIHDHQAVWAQRREQHLFDPGDHGQVSATGLKQHRGNPL